MLLSGGVFAQTGPVSYTIQRATNAGFTTGLTTLTVTQGSSFTSTGLTANTTYWFRIQASSGTAATTSGFSSVSVTTPSVAGPVASGGTGDITGFVGGVATASSDYGSQYGEGPGQAIDNSITASPFTTSQQLPTVVPQWWQWDAGAGNYRNPTQLRVMWLDSGRPDLGRQAKDFQVWGSNDPTFATKTVLLTVTGNTATVAGGTYQAFTFTQTGVFRYFRINVTAIVAAGAESFSMQELELNQP